jgi:type IV pilus assembly protein PilW
MMLANRIVLDNTPASRQRGVTLIELMVALLIGSILLIGAISVFSSSRQTFRTSEIIARLQENARFALDTIEPDIRQAAYWGLANGYTLIEGTATAGDSIPTGMEVTDDCEQNFSLDLMDAVNGGNDAFPYAGCPLFGAAVPNTDALVVRHASRNIEVGLTAGRLHIQSDREKIRVFNGTLGAIPADFDALTSETRNLVVNTYYLDQDSVLGDGIPSLRRIGLIAGPSMRNEEIIPYVQDFQVQLGADTTGDGAANMYVNPGNVPEGAVIVAVRVWLLFRADQIDSSYVNSHTYEYAGKARAFGDNFHRLLVSKTIQLRNTRF